MPRFSQTSGGLRLIGLACFATVIVACTPDVSGPPAEQDHKVPEPEHDPRFDPLTSSRQYGRFIESPLYFERENRPSLTTEELYSPGDSISLPNIAQAIELLDFAPRDFSDAIAGYHLLETAILADENSLQQCLSRSSSAPGSFLPRLCIRQQTAPFRELIGIEAMVYQLLSKESIDIEYAYGGWYTRRDPLNPENPFRWDDNNVNVMRLRYIDDGKFTEILYMGDDLILEDLIRIVVGSG